MASTRNDPIRNFRFSLEIDGLKVAEFSEVHPPNITVEAIDYRDGVDEMYVRKLSGLSKWGSVTLKRGRTTSLDLYEWIMSVKNKGAEENRKSLSIVVKNEAGKPYLSCKILEAWPVKYEMTDLNAKGNDVWLETIELVHEGFTLAVL